MNMYEFCGEYAKESASGRLTFTTAHKRRFCKLFTYVNYDLMTYREIIIAG